MESSVFHIDRLLSENDPVADHGHKLARTVHGNRGNDFTGNDFKKAPDFEEITRRLLELGQVLTKVFFEELLPDISACVSARGERRG